MAEIYRQAYAIVRVDEFQDASTAPEKCITVKKVVWDLGEAKSEVKRLLELNGGKRAVYFWQATRVQGDPEGR